MRSECMNSRSEILLLKYLIAKLQAVSMIAESH